MAAQLQTESKALSSRSIMPATTGLLQRKCACGNHTVAGGECAECAKKKSGLQRKLAMGASSASKDPLEREADRVADQVMATSPHSEFSSAPRRIQRYVGQATESTDTAPVSVDRVLASPGRPLEPVLRQDMEQRFGHDFSQVRVHTGGAAEQSARDVGAHAYTVGHNVVFGVGQFAPGTSEGRRLLAHELTHAVQQRAVSPTINDGHMDIADLQSESEADRAAVAVVSGSRLTPTIRNSGRQLARFSDTGHHVIEEAGLAGAGFSEEQIHQTEVGNVQRDYSQVGTVGNTLLLCQPRNFGGYQPEEHIDNFMWDAVTERWRTRGASAISEAGTPVDIGRGPIDYISDQLRMLARLGLNERGLIHLGNAFHTVEDFFAHSNFVELANGDFTFGRTLVTGSVDKADETVSISHVLESVSGPPMDQYYRERAERALPGTRPLSHSRIAHDLPASHNYAQARRLAALVIQDLGADVLTAMRGDPATRERLLNETVLAKVNRYLRPPNQTERWWESLTARDAGVIDRRLNEAERRSPVTVNQCIFSPLRNLEASQVSNLKIPIGVAVPVAISGTQIFIQGGLGVNTPLTLNSLTSDVPSRSDQQGAGLFAGGQITGRF